MNQRGYPLWLLRDWTAFFGFLIAFWAFIFAGFHAGRRAARGQRLSNAELQNLFQLYANAESRLDHALWRQAWRACGYSAKHAAFVQMPAPTNTQELETRFLAFKRALDTLESLVIAYTDDLRHRFNLSRAKIGDPNAIAAPYRAPVRRPSPSRNPHVCILRSARTRTDSPRATARGPPANPIPDCLFPTASLAQPARTPPHARFPSPPSRSSTRPWNCPSLSARPLMPLSPACRSPS